MEEDSYSKQRDKDSNKTARIVIRLIGLMLLAIGLVVLAFGLYEHRMTDMGDPDWFEQTSSAMYTLYLGAASIVIGVFLIILSYLIHVVSYFSKEYSPAIEMAGRSFGEGFTEASQQHVREVIKIRCPKCQHLEREGATYCSSCGMEL